MVVGLLENTGGLMVISDQPPGVDGSKLGNTLGRVIKLRKSSAEGLSDVVYPDYIMVSKVGHLTFGAASPEDLDAQRLKTLRDKTGVDLTSMRVFVDSVEWPTITENFDEVHYSTTELIPAIEPDGVTIGGYSTTGDLHPEVEKYKADILSKRTIDLLDWVTYIEEYLLINDINNYIKKYPTTNSSLVLAWNAYVTALTSATNPTSMDEFKTGKEKYNAFVTRLDSATDEDSLNIKEIFNKKLRLQGIPALYWYLYPSTFDTQELAEAYDYINDPNNATLFDGVYPGKASTFSIFKMPEMLTTPFTFLFSLFFTAQKMKECRYGGFGSMAGYFYPYSLINYNKVLPTRPPSFLEPLGESYGFSSKSLPRFTWGGANVLYPSVTSPYSGQDPTLPRQYQGILSVPTYQPNAYTAPRSNIYGALERTLQFNRTNGAYVAAQVSLLLIRSMVDIITSAALGAPAIGLTSLSGPILLMSGYLFMLENMLQVENTTGPGMLVSNAYNSVYDKTISENTTDVVLKKEKRIATNNLFNKSNYSFMESFEMPVNKWFGIQLTTWQDYLATTDFEKYITKDIKQIKGLGFVPYTGTYDGIYMGWGEIHGHMSITTPYEEYYWLLLNKVKRRW